MDPFSHALLSFVLGQALQLDPNAQIVLIISSVILDVDAISVPGWWTSFRFHRGPLHSFLAAILISLTLSTVYTALVRIPAEAYIAIALVSLGGSFCHIFLDLLTTGNMAVLWPFSSQRVAFDLTHFIDPAFLGVNLLASILIFCVKNDIEVIHLVTTAALILLTVSLGVRYYERDVAVDTIKRQKVYADSELVPLPTFRLDRWWVAAKTPSEDGYQYEIYSVDSIGHKILSHRTVECPFIDYVGSAEPPIDSPHKAVLYSKRYKQVSGFLRKSRLPSVDVTLSDEGNTWHIFWYDAFTQLSEGVSRGIIVRTDLDGMATVSFSARANA